MNGITLATQSTYNAASTFRAGQVNAEAVTYLAELRQKNPGINITVASFANDKQSDAYMFGSNGNNNLAIAPNILEEMASDPATAAKYEHVFKDVENMDERMKQYEKSTNSVVYASGAIIDKNGKVSYWGIAGDRTSRENPGTVFKEKIQKQLEETRKNDAERMQHEKRQEKADSPKMLVSKFKATSNTYSFENAVTVSISNEALKRYNQGGK